MEPDLIERNVLAQNEIYKYMHMIDILSNT